MLKSIFRIQYYACSCEASGNGCLNQYFEYNITRIIYDVTYTDPNAYD